MEAKPSVSFWQRNAVLIKAIVVGFLILVLLIPNAFITDLVRERQQRQTEVITEVSSKWASAQTITGPFLLVPYKEMVTTEKGKTEAVRKLAYFLPDQLKVNGTLFPEIRHRSIFQIVLYKSDLQVSGVFQKPDMAALGIPAENVFWNEVSFCVGLTDNRGIAEALRLRVNEEETDMNAGVPENMLAASGVNAPMSVFTKQGMSQASFSLRLQLKGSERLYFTPVAKETDVQLSASFSNPSFDGKFLPVASSLSDTGFKAHWNVLHFTRDIPQSWTNREVDVDKHEFGVQLLQGVDSYSKTMRTVKYALLFISLTFFLFFFIELLKKTSVHPLQYILVGFALSIFYTLLLSIGEYTGFNSAYLIATVATVGLITFYTRSVFGQWPVAIALFVFLTALYSFIYILIQLQDGALLFGSIGLFVLLAIVMYYSRKVDWYGTKKETEAELNSHQQ
jgi:inner membrane protein